MKKIGQCKFKEWDCDIYEYQYQSNGRTALQLIDKEDEGPVCIATVNVPDEDDGNGKYVFIKDYSENSGVFACLMDAGIISESIELIQRGHVDIYKAIYLK